MTPPTILVDVSNTAFRCGYAFQSLSSEGRKTGAIYGFLKTVYELRQKVSPRIVFVWDHGVPVPGAAKPANWRDAALQHYKATRIRSESGTEILTQMPTIYRALCLLGYSSVSVMGMEADDIIGILATEIPGPVLVFSTDKDFYQLLSDRVQVLVPHQEKGQYRQIDMFTVVRDYGVPVKRWAEYLALGGDTADNIKPMRGMGPKTAAKLLQSGVDLNRHPSEQPAGFWPKYGVVWREIQAAYQAARVPVSWSDPRIAECIKRAGGVPKYTATQAHGDKQKFIELLADHNMASLLSLRHEFFGPHTSPNHNDGVAPWKTSAHPKSKSQSSSPKQKPLI